MGADASAALAVPATRRRGEGRIVDVSSVAAHATGAMTGWYQACKYALTGVTDALRREVASDGIDVILVEPGGLGTGIWDKARDELVRRRATSATPTPYEQSLRVLDTARPFMGDPEAVARVIADALTAGHPRSQYRVGRDAPVIELLDFPSPQPAQGPHGPGSPPELGAMAQNRNLAAGTLAGVQPQLPQPVSQSPR